MNQIAPQCPSRLRVWGCRVVRWPLGVFLLYAGAIKLWQFSRFVPHVADFGIVFDSLVKPVAATVCLVELFLGVALLWHARGAVPAVISLLVCFCGVLSYGIAMGLDIECGCLGTGNGITLGTQLRIDLALLGWCFLIPWSCRHGRAVVSE